ncbi:MAG: phospho-N-acetylmuramoyl-pentapeptide-transferase [Chloroflexi bacterium]|nr:MAG: phospho-N-acetylmuramoyl-pentapeptide-transferase [Chloroflexota bacterium]TMD70536.1 MAG: phospho-N-acetylmuramoyl-pentapeptide-transferase [Chloroflexota bacterium]
MGQAKRRSRGQGAGEGVARPAPGHIGRRADGHLIFDLVTFVAGFAIALILYPPAIRLLRRLKAGQVIQEELPDTHQKKAGTPTGGGIVFVLVAVAGGVLATIAGHQGAWPAVAGLVAGGLIGFADDRSKLRVGTRGIPARLKLPIQVLLAVPVAWLAVVSSGPQLFLPTTPWLTFPLAVVALVATANAVNITDGMDGLAGGLSVIAVATVALLLPGAQAGEKAVAVTLCGAIVAFLVFNRYPARVFMGDTGSLAIGFALAAMAIQQGMLLLLPIVALVFVLETLSVIIQVAYFKATGGRRVFTMTPIHYTFHHEGWSENRIALSFWGAGLVSAIAAVALVRLQG